MHSAQVSKSWRFIALRSCEIESSWYFGRLSVSEVEACSEVGRSGESASVVLSVVGVHGSSHRLIGPGTFVFPLALEFGVLDVDTIFVDVSFLMVGSELAVSVSFQEDIFVAGSDCDVVVEFLDLFIAELVVEVDDQSSGNFVYFDPAGVNFFFLAIGDASGLVSVNFVELLGLDDVETEVFVFPDLFFCGGDFD